MAASRVPGPFGKDDSPLTTWIDIHIEAFERAFDPLSELIEYAHLPHHTGRAPPRPTGMHATPQRTDAKKPDLDPLGSRSTMRGTKSGKFWVTWADIHAKNSAEIDDLAEPFRSHVKEFIEALESAGAEVNVTATRRPAKRAYLFHWSWLIALSKCKASEAKPMAGVDIEWDHGDDTKSKAAAREMVDGFGLAVPPKSNFAPALHSNHIAGNAIDMYITWTGTLKVNKKDGTEVNVNYMADPNANTTLHNVGESYQVKKLKSDAPHWSVDGK